MNERDDERWDEALRSLREEPLDERLSGEVRAAVLGRIRRERRLRWAWLAAAAAALVLAAALPQFVEQAPAVVGQADGLRRPARPPVPVAEKNPQLVGQAPGLRRAPSPPKRVARRKPPAVEMPREPMKIQMLTDDPDLVIIWLAGEEGDLE